MSHPLSLQEQFGSIDIYLFDQLLKGRLTKEMGVLDAGRGGGRNLVYFMRNGFSVFGVDRSVESINQIRALATSVSDISRKNFRVESVERMSFADGSFDVVLSSAVLHFAEHEDHRMAMVKEMWRVLKPGGMFFARLASTVGQDQLKHIEGRRYQLPDGPDWLLVDFEMLNKTTTLLNGEWLEPFKTVVVHNKRSMSNWILRKQPL
nr:Methyltransferase domain protein [uncultured bacterium]